LASLAVTVKVEAAPEVAGEAKPETTSSVAWPGLKVTTATEGKIRRLESVVSVAESVADPARVEVTEKTACPAESEVTDAGEMRSVLAPRLEARVTVFPETGFPARSLRVTVTLAAPAPSAGAGEPESERVEATALTWPAVILDGSDLRVRLARTQPS
jgi:hypothetical protein